jgi:exodeoxyribonuclease V gamma subunit
VLPIGLIGQQYQHQLVQALVPVRCAWLTLRQHYELPAPKVALNLELAGVPLDDWIDQLRSNGSETVWLAQMSSRVADKQGKPRGDKLIAMWLRQLAVSATGMQVKGLLVARDAIVTMNPLPPVAQEALRELVCLWRDGMNRRCRPPARPRWRWCRKAIRAPPTTAASISTARTRTCAWRACGPTLRRSAPGGF